MDSSSESFKSISKILVIQENEFEKNIMISIMDSILKDYPLKFYLKILSYGVELIDEVIKDRREDFKIKCIILDENIQGISGSEAIRIIKDMEKDGKLKNIKVISTITNDSKDIIEKIITSGADLILKKPATKNNIHEALKKLMII
jgi:CheY-like chemotaxis protein